MTKQGAASPHPGGTYILRELAVPVSAQEPDLAGEIAKFLRIKRSRVGSVRILRKSLDSRRRNQPLWRYSVEFAFDGFLKHPRVTRGVASPAIASSRTGQESPDRYLPAGPAVAVIGSGPAGMATALGLSRKGYQVTVFEQGSDVGRRFKDIRRFLKGAAFNPHSNILFGEGGAGTFSDGKLTCRTRTPYTDAFLADLVACGADESITYLSHPHIGTDKLQFVIKALRERCEGLGCRFRFNTVVDDLIVESGRTAGVVVGGSPERFDAVILAAGHSSRSLYARLHGHGVAMEPKPFAVGVRVEHPQEMVNRRQYGDKVDVGLTGAAEYFLTWNGAIEPEAESGSGLGTPLRIDKSTGREVVEAESPPAKPPEELYDRTGNGSASTATRAAPIETHLREAVSGASADIHSAELTMTRPGRDLVNAQRSTMSAYSFCMCPGGVVVPCADAADGLFTNGMSYSNRAGAFANSAVVVPVTPEDLEEMGLAGPMAGAGPSAGANPLAGIEFIRSLEVKAFAMGGGEFTFPAQTIRAYMDGRLDEGPQPKTSFPKPLRWADFHELFPPKIALALRESFRNFDHKLPGFIDMGLIIGPESRTSSPLRVLRDPTTLESTSTRGLFPLGEGAGYSGGIVSSGADGLRMAEAWEEWAAGSAAERVAGTLPKSQERIIK